MPKNRSNFSRKIGQKFFSTVSSKRTESDDFRELLLKVLSRSEPLQKSKTPQNYPFFINKKCLKNAISKCALVADLADDVFGLLRL